MGLKMVSMGSFVGHSRPGVSDWTDVDPVDREISH